MLALINFEEIRTGTVPEPVFWSLEYPGCIDGSTMFTTRTRLPLPWLPKMPAQLSSSPCSSWPWSVLTWWAATHSARPCSTSSTPGWPWRTTVTTIFPGPSTSCCPAWAVPPSTRLTTTSTEETTPPTSYTGIGCVGPGSPSLETDQSIRSWFVCSVGWVWTPFQTCLWHEKCRVNHNRLSDMGQVELDACTVRHFNHQDGVLSLRLIVSIIFNLTAPRDILPGAP